jgi:hypothetical protein
MDSMDFVLNDLEQPEAVRRHADFCTGDLTGRYLEMLARSMPHDDSCEARMEELLSRILKCRTLEGPVGRPYAEKRTMSDKDRIFGVGYKLFAGLLRYYLFSGNGKALDLALDNGEYFLANIVPAKNILAETKKKGGFALEWWITEPMALLYGITGDKKWLEVCGIIADALPPVIDRAHSHGLMTTLRGLQLAAVYSGDAGFNVLPEKFRKDIAEKAEWADGNIPEAFPISGRNEGCSIADWLMLNLYSGFISGNDEAYETAERVFYNALSLNQLVNGSFGHRRIRPDRRGYLPGVLGEEAWWCCIHNCTNGLIEFANHAVTLRDNTIKVNLLVPGRYRFTIDGRPAVIDITTAYPEKAKALILASGLPEGVELKIRVPSCVKNAGITMDRQPGGNRRYTLKGDIGYYLENRPEGTLLKYGPMVLVPLSYVDENPANSYGAQNYTGGGVPEGYIPEHMPGGYPAIVPPQKTDAAGFLVYDREPFPVWQGYEEGVWSSLAYGDLSVNVPLLYPDGTIRSIRFYPEHLSTTTLIGCDLPVVFNRV